MRMFSKRITRWLIKNNAIAAEDDELYEYAVYSLLITISPVVMVLCFGVIMDMVLPGIVLLFPFMSIRKFSGGYHAKTPIVCFFSSCALVITLLLIAGHADNGIAIQILLCISCVLLAALSPIDSANRRLSDAEVPKYKRITIYMCVFYAAVYILLTVCSKQQYAVCIALGIVLTAGLMIPCGISKLYEMHSKKNETNSSGTT